MSCHNKIKNPTKQNVQTYVEYTNKIDQIWKCLLGPERVAKIIKHMAFNKKVGPGKKIQNW